MPSLNDLDRLDPITVLMYLNLFQVSKLNPLISASTAERWQGQYVDSGWGMFWELQQYTGFCH